MIYALLIGLIIQLIYCYYVFDRDVLSPSAIICEVFIMTTLACLYSISGTNYDIQPITAFVILGGNTVFILVSTIIHFLFRSKRVQFKKTCLKKMDYINIGQFNLIIITISYILFSALFVIMSMSIIKGLGSSGDFSSAMNAYRSTMLDEGSSLPGWLTKLNVVFNLGVFILLYVFINNFLINRREKRNYVLLFCVVIYLLASIFTAQRTTILIVFMYTLFVSYSLLSRKYNLAKKINFKYVRRGLIVVVVFLLLFGLTRGLFGRVSKTSPIDSVAHYMGNSIEFLDYYIKKPTGSKQNGEELFRQFRTTLSGFGLMEKPEGERFLEFRLAVAGNYGNIYTGYREYIHDYGYGSIIIFQTALALFFGIWYEKLNSRKLKDGIDLSFVYFAWFVAYVLFRFSIVNALFVGLSYFVFTHWYVFLFWKMFCNAKFTTGRVAVSDALLNNKLNVSEEQHEV